MKWVLQCFLEYCSVAWRVLNTLLTNGTYVLVTVVLISEINGLDKENKCNSLTENKECIQEENQTDSKTRNDKLGVFFFHFGK